MYLNAFFPFNFVNNYNFKKGIRTKCMQFYEQEKMKTFETVEKIFLYQEHKKVIMDKKEKKC